MLTSQPNFCYRTFFIAIMFPRATYSQQLLMLLQLVRIAEEWRIITKTPEVGH